MSLQTPALAPFHIDRVIARAGAMIRARWGSLLIVLVAGNLMLQVVVTYSVRIIVHLGVPWFALRFAVPVIQALINDLSLALVVAVALAATGGARTFDLLPAIGRGGLALLAIWLLNATGTYWTIWSRWHFDHLSRGNIVEYVNELLAANWIRTLVEFLLVAAACVVVPVAIAELRGPTNTFIRAWRLMNGARWKLVALFLVFFLALNLLGLGQDYLYRAHRELDQPLAWASYSVRTFLDGLWSVITAAAYIELRRRHDGSDADEIASAFH